MKKLILTVSAALAIIAAPAHTSRATSAEMCCDCCRTGVCQCAECACCDCDTCPACQA